MNALIIWVLLGFLFAGVIDKILGNKKGYGEAFDEGFRTMGPLAFVMTGMISIAPLLAEVLRPVLVPIFTALGADPGIFPGMILAIDMGGYPLAAELARTEEAALFSGIILATMLGPTFVFTVPVALGLIHKEHYTDFARGIMYGLIPVPAGAFIAGMAAGMEPLFILRQLVPVILFVGIILIGLRWAQRIMVQAFLISGRGIMALIAMVIAVVAVQELTGVVLIAGLTPFSESMEIIGVIVLALAGAFPLVHFLKTAVVPKCRKLIERTPLPAEAWVGFFTQLAHSIPVFKQLHTMDERSRLMNVAFSVSGAFLVGGHLGFTAAVEPAMTTAMLTGKASAGVMAVLLVFWKTSDKKPAGS
ncbi:ethanolamine utilization protein EutH [Alkalicoccus halolimnae]|uniref:Ethanolamine utilization protein EutH n=1 Tax=Alkalicoccus halolimnae TaxID=1667239 RepID=A0A5C7FK02_9BACI|nr:ethanolamine utilization protein EutH [Alkalicoccus halolimnae]TXF86614.1 ethanolamine utilization protein EutH [Alkalicoccus halolimnae]